MLASSGERLCVLVLMIAVEGCHTPQDQSPLLRVSIWAEHMNGGIDLYSSGETVHKLTHRFFPPAEPSDFEREYVLQSHRCETEALLQTLQAVRSVRVPSSVRSWAGPGSLAKLRVFDAPGRGFGWQVSELDLSIHPFWQGLFDECAQTSRRDLAAGIFHQDVAEVYAQSGLVPLACSSYAESLRSLVNWRLAEHLRSREYYIDDSELLLSDPLSLIESGQYRRALPACRESYKDLLEGVHLKQGDDGRVRVTFDSGALPSRGISPLSPKASSLD